MGAGYPPSATPFDRALGERERRALETASLLAAGAATVVRLSARMPWAMREAGRADGPLALGAAAFESACRGRGLILRRVGSGSGALGPWTLWTSDAPAGELKRTACSIEEGSSLGRLLDLDVACGEGLLGRSSLGLPPRPCVVCASPASVCSGRAAHGAEAVEAAFIGIIERASRAIYPGSPDGSAVGAYQSSTIREIAYQGGDTP